MGKNMLIFGMTVCKDTTKSMVSKLGVFWAYVQDKEAKDLQMPPGGRVWDPHAGGLKITRNIVTTD